MPQRIEIASGTRFKMLTVINEIEPRIRSNGKIRRVLLCRCDCGVEKKILFQSFTVGRVASCGCLQKKIVKEGAFARKHGLSAHPLFTVWKRMIERCTVPNSKNYGNYGGRGISVCDAWINNPEAFVKWCLTNGWQYGLEMDRRNNNGNYDPSNIRFVTRHVNMMNRRCTKESERL